MIPYDDLVVALQTWRARRGLPVGQMSGSMTPPPPMAAPPVAARPPTARPAPPARPPTAPQRPPVPPPMAPPDDHMDVDEAALLEETHYDNEGGNYSIGFGGVQHEAESTAIGMPPGPPPRSSEATLVGSEPSDTVDGLPPPPMTPGGRKRDDW